MKRIFGLLLVLFALFGLTACGDKEEDHGASFNEYLNEHGTLTVEKLDSAFTEFEQASPEELPSDFFTKLKLDNIHMAAEMESLVNKKVENVYVWQNENKIYMVDEKDGRVIENYFVDLAFLETYYDQITTQIPVQEVKPSEVLEQAIVELRKEYDLPEALDLEMILNVLSFKYEDFNDLGDGKFQVKEDAILGKMCQFFDNQITVEQLKEAYAQAKLSFNIYVYFTGEIDKIELEVNQDGTVVTLGLGLSYQDGEINGVNVTLTMGENNKLYVSMKVVDKELHVEADLTSEINYGSGIYPGAIAEPRLSNTKVKLVFSQSKLVLNVVVDEVALVDVNFNITNTKIVDVYQFGINGTATINDGNNKITLTVKSGSNAVIPSNILALQSQAKNAFGDINEEVK